MSIGDQHLFKPIMVPCDQMSIYKQIDKVIRFLDFAPVEGSFAFDV